MSLDGLALRSLRARPLRTALSILGVALGVAVLFAGLATNAGIEASIDGTVRELVGRAELRVAAFGESGLSGATVTTIAGTPGVAVAAPALERRTYLIPDLAAGTALPPPVTVLGIDPAVDGQVHDLTLVAGSPLAHRRRAERAHHRAAGRGGRAERRLPAHDAGVGRPGRLPGHRHHRRRRTADRGVRSDGGRAAADRAGGLRRHRREQGRHRPRPRCGPGGRLGGARDAPGHRAVRAVLAT